MQLALTRLLPTRNGLISIEVRGLLTPEQALQMAWRTTLMALFLRKQISREEMKRLENLAAEGLSVRAPGEAEPDSLVEG